MNELIPATPGWYVQEPDGSLDPVIAWKAVTADDGESALLPYLDGGSGYVPYVMSTGAIRDLQARIVYRPNHDPAE